MRHPFLYHLRNVLLLSGVIALFGGFLAALWLAFQSGSNSDLTGVQLIQARFTIFGAVFVGAVLYFGLTLLLTDAIRWMLNVEAHLYSLRPEVKMAMDEAGFVSVGRTEMDPYAPPTMYWYDRAGEWLLARMGVTTPEVVLDAPQAPSASGTPAEPTIKQNVDPAQAEGTAVAHTHEPTDAPAADLPEPMVASPSPFVETDSMPVVQTELDAFSFTGMTDGEDTASPPAPDAIITRLDPPNPAPQPTPQSSPATNTTNTTWEPESEPAMRPLSKHQRKGVTGELRKLPKTDRLGKTKGQGQDTHAEHSLAGRKKQAALHVQRATKHFKNGNIKKAGQHFYLATQLDPDHERARHGYEHCRELIQQGEPT